MLFMKDNKPSSSFPIPTTLLLLLIFIATFSSPARAAGGANQNDIVSWLREMAVLVGNNSNGSGNGVVSLPWLIQKTSLVNHNATTKSAARANETAAATPLVLAADRTRRKDPTDGLRYYDGGWNISNTHYITSALFTGFPLFLIAGIWFLGFGIFLLLACAAACRRRKPQNNGGGGAPYAYALSLVLLVLFTVAAIVGSGVLLAGQEKLHVSTRETAGFVVGEADTTVENLRNVSEYLRNAKGVAVDRMFLPQQVQDKIDEVNSMISSAADTLGTATNDNKDNIFRILDTVRVVLIVVASVMLLLALLGLVLSILGMRRLVYALVVLGWILVVLTFTICGVFLVLHNVMGDTCTAMNEWSANPTVHTALDEIIPCVEEATAEEAVSESKAVTFQVVQLVNLIIRNLSNANNRLINYNQSGPLVPALCSPYNGDLTDRTCAPGEVSLGSAGDVWRAHVCRVSGGRCVTAGRLTPEMYEQMSGAAAVSYGLHHYGPFLAELVDCTFVRSTMRRIHREHCPGLRKYSEWVYVGLAVVSAAVMVALILWVVYARERRHRTYWKIGSSPTRGSTF
ncbi:uncharacterized protein LOC127255020 [Andrographis paniculata]|uniref:uncharacterized protein LOC127255020 n=1 Tax=Andrographis paniculata TaxID=175694 RepID=UPI0021E904A0|nr:uncharacterized protein LOC127255020 [Andrographis paniculata]